MHFADLVIVHFIVTNILLIIIIFFIALPSNLRLPPCYQTLCLKMGPTSTPQLLPIIRLLSG